MFEKYFSPVDQNELDSFRDDCFLFSEKNYQKLRAIIARPCVTKLLDKERYPPEVGRALYGNSRQGQFKGSVGCCRRFNLFVNISSGAYIADVLIPDNSILNSFTNGSGKVFVVLTDHEYSRISKGHLVSFLYVDIIGTKALIQTHGEVPYDKYRKWQNHIDEIAAEHPDCLFMSYADSIIIRQERYMDELGAFDKSWDLLNILSRTEAASQRIFSSAVFGILTQGLLTRRSSDLSAHPCRPTNHIFFETVDQPFSDIFAIEKIVNKKVKELKTKTNVYLTWESALGLSSRFQYRFPKHDQGSMCLSNRRDLEVLFPICETYNSSIIWAENHFVGAQLRDLLAARKNLGPGLT